MKLHVKKIKPFFLQMNLIPTSRSQAFSQTIDENKFETENKTFTLINSLHL